METRLSSNKFSFLKHSLGYINAFLVARFGQGGDLIMLWREDLDVRLINYSMGHIDVWIEHGLLKGGCFLAGFYGHWSVSQTKHSWELLQSIGSHRQRPWCVMGDFNEILYAFELDSHCQRPSSQMEAFRRIIDALHLTKICMEHTTFTWWNK